MPKSSITDVPAYGRDMSVVSGKYSIERGKELEGRPSVRASDHRPGRSRPCRRARAARRAEAAGEERTGREPAQSVPLLVTTEAGSAGSRVKSPSIYAVRLTDRTISYAIARS